MHSARLDHSPRLQRVLELLSSGAEYSTRGIMIGADVCAVNSCIAELRDNGYAIATRQENRNWFYRLERPLATLLLTFALLLAWPWMGGDVAMAGVPRDAVHYRADLVRSARLAWGLDAPVATFAAQIHQESAWRAAARSPVGARGLAQFMPATARWIAGAYPRELGSADVANPTWAMRALTRYDRWIWERVPVEVATNPPRPPFSKGGGISSDCGRMAATLRGYNGGLGWVLKEARAGRPCEAFRSAASCRENLAYPRRILGVLEPVYVAAGWGHGVCG